MHDPRLLDHAFFLLVGVILPLQVLLSHQRGWGGATLSTREKLLVYWMNSAVLGALSLVLLWLWRRGGSSLEALGLGAEPREGAPWWILGLVALGYLADVGWKLLPARRAETAERMRRDAPFLPANARELAHSAAMVVGSGVFEELLYRGFAIAYLLALGAPPVVAVVAPAVPFALGHVYQGPVATLKVALLAVLFGWFYAGAGVLWPLFLVHAAIDAAGMLLALRLWRAYPAPAAPAAGEMAAGGTSGFAG